MVLMESWYYCCACEIKKNIQQGAVNIFHEKYTSKDGVIIFDFTSFEDKEYFIPRFKIFIDEIRETKTIHEQYHIIFKYKDNQNQ
jgi:hypothetical protein